ncbi:MAG: Gfo/Idh/MocA family oxidoreductase [Burkholderiales bacterium]
MTFRAPRLALVGTGGWGRNLARTLGTMPEAEVRWLCDLDPRTLRVAAPMCPQAAVTTSLDDVLADPMVEAVLVATPAVTHHAIGRRVLESGRDLYVEKPMALDVGHGIDLLRLAQANDRVLMVGHLLEYHPAVLALRDAVADGSLGRIRTIVAQRLNLGTVRSDENAMWSLAPHDVSAILFLLGEMPTDVSARGLSCLDRGVEDVAFVTLRFGEHAIAQIHSSWLDPCKTRTMTVVGTRRMAVFDDLEPVEKLRFHDKHAETLPSPGGVAGPVVLHSGAVVAPALETIEPLRAELAHFIDCVRTRATPTSDGHDGLRVLRVLEAAQRSLAAGGAPMKPRAIPAPRARGGAPALANHDD